MRDETVQHSELEAQIAGLLRADLYSQARISWGMNFLLLIVGFCALQGLSLDKQLSSWAGVGALVFLLRLPVVLSVSRTNAPSVNKPLYLVGLFLCGLVWGAFAFVNLPVQQDVLQLTVVALPMLVCMVALMTLSAWMPAFHAFMWPLAIPFVATLVLHAEGAYQSMLPLVGCFFGFNLMFAHVINRHARTRAMMLIQNNTYVRELSNQNIQFNRARVKAESALDELKARANGTSIRTRVEAEETPTEAEDELAFLDDALNTDVSKAGTADNAEDIDVTIIEHSEIVDAEDVSAQSVDKTQSEKSSRDIEFEEQVEAEIAKALDLLDVDLDKDDTVRVSAA